MLEDFGRLLGLFASDRGKHQSPGATYCVVGAATLRDHVWWALNHHSSAATNCMRDPVEAFPLSVDCLVNATIPLISSDQQNSNSQ